MTGDVQTFRVTVLNFGTLARDRARRALQAFYFDVCRAVATKEGRWGPGTPVDTGVAAGSWRFGVGAPPSGPSDAKADGISAVSDFHEILDADLGDQCYLGSACVYMPALEGGWSKQAPTGMVAVVLSQGQAILDDAVQRVQA